MGGRISRPTVLGSSLGLVAALAFAGCDQSSHTNSGLRVIDDAGDTLVLSRPAMRVVSLAPATTELLFAIGAGPVVVGRTAWCDYPPEATAIPNVGDGLRPNIEAVLARRPDLVVLYNSGHNADAVGQFRRLGVPALRLNTDLLGEVGRHARLLGRLTDHDAEAEAFAADFGTALDRARTPPSSSPLRLFVLAWDQPPMTIGGGSFQSELVERAGGRNIFGDLEAASAPVSIEAVAHRDPDFILILGEDIPAIADRPEWNAVRAVRERRFLHIVGSEFSRPGPRAPEAVHTLAEAFRSARP